MRYSHDPQQPAFVGQTIRIKFELDTENDDNYDLQVFDPNGVRLLSPSVVPMTKKRPVFRNVALQTEGLHDVRFKKSTDKSWTSLLQFDVGRSEPNLQRVTLVAPSEDDRSQQQLWDFITGASDRLRFPEFVKYFEEQRKSTSVGYARSRLSLGGPNQPAFGMPTYEYLHRLTTQFVTQAAIGRPHKNDGSELSYVTLQSKDEEIDPFPPGVDKGHFPLLGIPFTELIYVYWLEEAMLFQSLNHIIARFQNRRVGTSTDPLSRLAVSPLLPLRGLLWGLTEAERERLSVRRRDHEYGYEYGLKLVGRAVPRPELAVERRTQFLPAFHALLHAAHHYYKDRDNLTVQADAFPLLNGLRELHLVLAQGANNQFGDLPFTARVETLDVQWMLAQPEMHQFLGGRTMVPYAELWMDRVDTMKSLYGWSDVSVTHFFDLAIYGEQLVLSVRHGDWNDTMSTMRSGDAENWAVQWRDPVQRYIHAYQAVTGVNLGVRPDTTMPSTLLSRRLAKQFV